MSRNGILKLGIILMFPFASSAQTDTIYYNWNWQVTKSAYMYYRSIEVDGDVINVNDYFKNGKKQMTGKVQNTSSAFRNLQWWAKIYNYEQGEFYWMMKDGRTQRYIHYSPFESPSVHAEAKALMLDSARIANADTNALSFERYFYRNGKIRTEGFLLNEAYAHGVWIKRHKRTGQIIRQASYDNNHLFGQEKLYYPSGKLMNTTVYVDGKKDGVENNYKRNGKIKSTTNYKEGIELPF